MCSNFRSLLLAFAVLGFSAPVVFCQPVINSFIPSFGPPNTIVTINGSNFNTDTSEMLVYFGGVRAHVLSANPSQMTVVAPVGATHDPICVTDLGTGLSGFSKLRFIETFTCNGGMISSSFAPRQDFSCGAEPACVKACDINNDGKVDMLTANNSDSTFSVMINQSTMGNMSFAPYTNFSMGHHPQLGFDGPCHIDAADLDGDGLLDVIVSNYNTQSICIRRNISTPGTVQFDTVQRIQVGSIPYNFAIDDLNGDGRPEIVTANAGSSTISVLRNTSSGDTLSFAPCIDIPSTGTTKWVEIGDFNNDGKKDIACAMYAIGRVHIFQNTTASDSITFLFAGFLNALGATGVLGLGDFDLDGRLDIVTTNGCPGMLALTVFRNTTINSSITFSSQQIYDLDHGQYSVNIADIDGDSRPDLIADAYYEYEFSVFKNVSSPGTILFAPKFDISTPSPVIAACADLDGDHKMDLVARHFIGTSYLSIYRNSIQAPYVTIPDEISNCSGTAVNLNLTASTASTFVWLPSDNPWVLGESVTTQSTATIEDTLINTSAVTQQVVYSIIGTDVSNLCVGDTHTLTINVENPVVQTATLNGENDICSTLQVYYYSIIPLHSATSYQWTSPLGSQIVTTDTGRYYTFNTAPANGTIIVAGKNSCGLGPDAILNYTVHFQPATPVAISGPDTVCPGQNSVCYSIVPVAGATSYHWDLPSGSSGASTTDSIYINFASNAANGLLAVRGVNECFQGAYQNLGITVPAQVLATGYITGPQSVCQGQDSIVFVCSPISNATHYLWGFPFGVSGSGTTNQITLDFSNTASSGNITVAGYNLCYTGPSTFQNVMVKTIPPTPVVTQNGNILHSNWSYGNQWHDTNGIISGATDQDYTVTENGVYWVIVTPVDCPSEPSNYMSFANVGVTENEGFFVCNAYPNPFDNEIYLSTSKSATYDFQMVNELGQAVLTGRFQNEVSLETRTLKSGVYNMMVWTGDEYLKFVLIKL